MSELTTQQAKEILNQLGITFVPSKGKAVDQALQALAENGKTLNEKGEVVDIFNGPSDDSDDSVDNTPENTQANDGAESDIQNTKDGKEYTMDVNVMHNGKTYFANKNYKLDKQTAELFKKHKFVK